MIKIALIPIDNRPICYDLIKDVININKDIELFMPDIKDLGGLESKSNIKNLFKFIENLDKVDYFIVSLDTVAYGGLVASRRCPETFDEIKERIEKFKSLISNKAEKILAFSSIMRISNNNINEEEKEYWSSWGKRIFDWSYHLHKSQKENTYNCVHNIIPSDILEDYLQTRKRNYKINKIYLDWAAEGFFDTLILSKDDCANYGLNVKEAQELQKIINEKNILQAHIKTGADEIPLSLITRALLKDNKVKIKPIFTEESSLDLISKYEDISVRECTKAQIELAGAQITEENQDLALIVNNFKYEQGDLVLGEVVNSTDKNIDFAKNCFIADINNANGSDNNFVRQLLNQENDFFGYCAYNTSANSLGCAIFCAVVKFLALKNNSYDDFAFKKFQFIRLVDDWLYQAKYRKYIREKGGDFSQTLKEKEDEIKNNSKLISKFLNFYPQNINLTLPWERSFEIRIIV